MLDGHPTGEDTKAIPDVFTLRYRPMVPPTRRRFLQVATAVAGGLAGCSGFTGDDAEVSRSSSEDGTNPPHSDTETDPPMVHLRSETELPPIYESGSEEEFTEPSRFDRPSGRYLHALVDSESSSDRLVVADHVDGDPVTPFVSETDFDSETLYLETRRVEACYRLDLCYVSWAPDDIHTSYVRRLRPYDEHCATDATAYESRLVRIPAALDEDSVTSHGSSVSGGGRCGGAGPDGAARSGTKTTEMSPSGGGE